FDARGFVQEPHGGRTIPLGTKEVFEYLASWAGLSAPEMSYSHVLLCEKEGFIDQFNDARIGDRFDVAVGTTKGMSVTAARMLVEGLSARGITTLPLHDFDFNGVGICYNLGHNTRRYKFKCKPLITDIGLTWDDVQNPDWGLEGELVSYPQELDPK